jgi:3-methyl-2-oxobutanoate hydroxymethyltransferase
MERVGIQTLRGCKSKGEKFVVLAVSDYPFAKLAEEAEIPCLLVGDSIGMTVYGFPSLLPVTMDLMIPHTSAARKGAPNAFLIGDLPFLTYEISAHDAVRNAGRFMAECGCDAVKLEGGRSRVETVKCIVSASIPVVGHIGFTPQAMAMSGGFQPSGQDQEASLRLVEDASMLVDAGVCMLMLEAVPADVAAIITERSPVPVIGFGSGPEVHGQILLLHDLIGMFEAFTGKFAKRYLEMGESVTGAMARFKEEVKVGEFPKSEHYGSMPDGEAQKLRSALAGKASLL